MPSQAATAEVETPQEQQPQDAQPAFEEALVGPAGPAGPTPPPESAEKNPPRKVSTRQADRLRQEAFVRFFTTPTGPEYLHGTKSAESAGYSKATAASQASRLLKRPRIRELIDRATSEITAKLTAEGEITVAFVERQHLEAMSRCRIAGDRTNEREHLECLGKMKGAYDVSLHLDLTVKHEYDERLALEVSRLARLALEDAGARGLGAGTGVGAKALEGDCGPPGVPGEAETAPATDGEGDRTPSAPAVEGAEEG